MTTIHKRPSLLLVALEARSLYELGAFYAAFPFLQRAPKGDGHPIMVLPGFMADDFSTLPLRLFLKSRGYAVYGWGQGRNYGRGIDPNEGIPQNANVLARLKRIKAKHGERKISLIGWSLGGIYARELARMSPDKIRSVITLGSPFNGDIKANNVRALFERMSGRTLNEIDPDLIERLKQPPPVPATAIYSKTDGVAAWSCCVEQETPHTESIEVISSHSGFGHNPLVLWVIADRLAQTEGAWQPFKMKGGFRSLLYGPTCFSNLLSQV